MMDPIGGSLKGMEAGSQRTQIIRDRMENERLIGEMLDQQRSCPATKTGSAINSNYTVSEGANISGCALSVSVSGKEVRVTVDRDNTVMPNTGIEPDGGRMGKVRFLIVSGLSSGAVAVWVRGDALTIDVNDQRFYITREGMIVNKSEKEVSAEEKTVVWAALADVSEVLSTMSSKEERYCAIAQAHGTVNASHVEKNVGKHFEGRGITELNSNIMTTMSMVPLEVLE